MRFLLIGIDEQTNSRMVLALKSFDCVVDVIQEAWLAKEVLELHKFDLIVVNSEMEQPSAMNIMSEYIVNGGQTPFMFLVPRNGIHAGINALESGADDFIHMPLIVDEFLARIRAVIRRRQNHKMNLLKFGPINFEIFSRTVWLGDARLNLTTREKSVLEVLMKRPGQMVSKELILSYLYTIDDDVSLGAIQTYVHRLRSKIKHPSIAIKTAWGCGYVLELVK